MIITTAQNGCHINHITINIHVGEHLWQGGALGFSRIALPPASSELIHHMHWLIMGLLIY
jgi:hypothetical protein